MITAIVPLKSFRHAKSRLSGRLSPCERVTLAEAMATDVLDALRHVAGITRPVVITEDAEVAAFAQSNGADVVTEPGRNGYNAAVACAANAIATAGADGMLVLPGDLPALSADDIEALIAAHGDGPGLTLCPDRSKTGTNALVISPPNAISFAFGPDSFRLHRITGQAAGLAVRTFERPGIAFDVDSHDDFADLASMPVGKHTSRFLEIYTTDADQQSAGTQQQTRMSNAQMAEKMDTDARGEQNAGEYHQRNHP